MCEKQQNTYSFEDLKVYYPDIIKMEKIMKQLHELLFRNLPDVTRSRVRLYYCLFIYIIPFLFKGLFN
jgi:hypothetical protein